LRLTATREASSREADRLLIAFAMGTGLRESEQWNLHLADVSADRKSITVRYGSNPGHQRNRRNARAKAGPTKGGKPRTVPIFGLAREALLRWLEILPKRSNKFRLVWPSPEGCRRQPKEPALWKKWLKAAGIVAEKREDQMPVRWHDLRHTCAASLVSGWWGRRWSIEEIKELLGHQDITTTQRYAHLHEQALQTAANEADRTRNRALKRVRQDDRPANLVVLSRDLHPVPSHLGFQVIEAKRGVLACPIRDRAAAGGRIRKGRGVRHGPGRWAPATA
jgi:integrase